MDDAPTPVCPAGMVEVTHEQFFAALSADRRDIMPNNEVPEFANWRVQRNRELWGRTYPGWKYGGDGLLPKVYYVNKTAISPPVPLVTAAVSTNRSEA